eukprot:TRINITY_DN3172_c0_g1_i1.p1 TRINITY_DN3172_c0_g1~~TRINITY_DN3172_c0_g1_i1.p1  ORF type:complete len:323 (+),score=78.12 TRINITY_DN3172_c0_g1_i1:81-1049(+)
MFYRACRYKFTPAIRCYGTSYDHDIGFIGLGQMGYRMAQNLIKKGKKVVVYDVLSETIRSLEKEGASGATTPKEVANKAPLIITMLPSSPHVRDCYVEGTDSILKGLQPGQLYIDSSTIDPVVARELHKFFVERGVTFIDAPVSGGVGGAQNATLTFMVGGTVEALERARPVLSLMGKNIIHCGDSGNGLVAKLANNLVLAISMAGVSEAMNLGIKLGVDPKVLASVMNTSSGRCWSSDTYNPVPGVIEGVPSSRDYEGGFGVDLMAKDVSLASAAAQGIGEKLPLGDKALFIYNLLSSQGFGKKDFSFVYKYLADRGELGS